MDRVVVDNPSDFHAARQVASGTAGDATATHYVRTAQFITLRDSDEPGTILFKLPLDVVMDSTCVQLAASYERYSISDVKLDIQSTSPLGSSSGGMQICYISDPANVIFEESAGARGKNIDKAIRQSGSIFIRPRDSCTQTYECDGLLFTKAQGDPRLFSYGCIVGVCRVPPALGDIVNAAVTFSCAVHFQRTAVVDNTVQVSKTVLMEKVYIEGDKLCVQLPPDNYSTMVGLQALRPFNLQIEQMLGSNLRTRAMTFNIGEFALLPEKPFTFYLDLNKYVAEGNFHSASIDPSVIYSPVRTTYAVAI